jgi:hypothetical protein
MRSTTFIGAAALALLAVPAMAQEAATGDQQIRDTAMQSAQGVGIQDVAAVEGALVLQGISATGLPVLMVVGPSGELLGIANPILSPTAEQTAATGTATAEEGAAPTEGEPAESGYMATQAQPAAPQMWDPAAVESALQSPGGAAGGAGTEQPEQ